MVYGRGGVHAVQGRKEGGERMDGKGVGKDGSGKDGMTLEVRVKGMKGKDEGAGRSAGVLGARGW